MTAENKQDFTNLDSANHPGSDPEVTVMVIRSTVYSQIRPNKARQGKV